MELEPGDRWDEVCCHPGAMPSPGDEVLMSIKMTGRTVCSVVVVVRTEVSPDTTDQVGASLRQTGAYNRSHGESRSRSYQAVGGEPSQLTET